MHQVIRKNVEEHLKGSRREIPPEFHRHLETCPDCASELAQLETQSRVLRSLAATTDAEPRPGFYARVMERIEAQQPFSIWSVFLDRKFGFRLAVASGVLAFLLGGYLVTSEPGGPESGVTSAVAMSDSSNETNFDQAAAQQQRDAVLVDLASFRQ
jgi:anti-sigma factor RsiW